MKRYLLYAAAALGGVALFAGAAQAQTFLSAQQILNIVGPIATQAQVQNILDQLGAGTPISQIGTPLARDIKCNILANVGSPIPNFSTECGSSTTTTPGGGTGGGSLTGTVQGSSTLTGSVGPVSSTSGTLGGCAVSGGGNTLTGTVSGSGNTLTGTVLGTSTLTGTVAGNTLTGTVTGPTLTGTVTGPTLTGTVTGNPCTTGGGGGSGGPSGGGGGGSNGPPAGGGGGGVLGTSTGPSLPGAPTTPGVLGTSTGPSIPNTGAGGDAATTAGMLALSICAALGGTALLRRLSLTNA